MSIILRPYQEQAIKEIRSHYANGIKNVLLHMATGSGKTVIFSYIIKRMSERGKRCILVVRGRELVDNASRRLIREHVSHGVLMANHSRYDLSANVQVCSIDTLIARKDKIELPKADMLIIDETHFAVSEGFRWLIDHYKKQDIYILGVTATPHVKNGLRHLADVVVYPITIRQLIEQNYLVKPRYFSVPHDIDLNSVKIDCKTGDYNLVDLNHEMERASITGDIIAHYRQLAMDRPALLFACSIVHSKSIVENLNNAGIPSIHIDADSTDAARQNAIELLSKRQIKIISNVGIFCTGVDVPFVSCIILARPTKSYNLYIQQCGRGTRLFDDKTDFIVLDHVGNVFEHGFIEDERLCELSGKSFSIKKKIIIRCKKCYHAWNPQDAWNEENSLLFTKGKHGKSYICHGIVFEENQKKVCGFDNTPVVEKNSTKSILSIDGTLKEILNEAELIENKQKKFLNGLLQRAIYKGFKPGWIYHQLKIRYGEIIARQKYQKIKHRIYPSGS